MNKSTRTEMIRQFVGGRMDGQSSNVETSGVGDQLRVPFTDDPFMADLYVLNADGKLHYQSSGPISSFGGDDGNHALAGDIINFVAGSMRRERQRIAEILGRHDVSPSLIAELLDTKDDRLVFRWLGPRNGLRKPL